MIITTNLSAGPGEAHSVSLGAGLGEGPREPAPRESLHNLYRERRDDNDSGRDCPDFG